LPLAFPFPEPFAGHGLFEDFTRQIAEIAPLRAHVEPGDVTSVTWDLSPLLVINDSTSDVDLGRRTLGALPTVIFLFLFLFLLFLLFLLLLGRAVTLVTLSAGTVPKRLLEVGLHQFPQLRVSIRRATIPDRETARGTTILLEPLSDTFVVGLVRLHPPWGSLHIVLCHFTWIEVEILFATHRFETTVPVYGIRHSVKPDVRFRRRVHPDEVIGKRDVSSVAGLVVLVGIAVVHPVDISVVSGLL